MLRLQNKIHIRTSKRGIVWIAGFDSQSLYYRKQPPKTAQLPEEQAEPGCIVIAPSSAPESWVLIAAKWLGLSVAVIILTIVTVNLAKAIWR